MSRPLGSAALLALLKNAVAASIPTTNNLSARAADPFDVNAYAALGESFASGPSAGELYGNDYPACNRFTHAFGPELNGDDRLEGTDRKFDFIACSGSKLKQVYEDNSSDNDKKPKKSQANQLEGKNPDMTTMSMGGNDIGFVNLLDHCVYRFYDPLCLGCGWNPFNGDCSSDCDKTVTDTQAKIDGDDLANAYDSAINAIFEKAPKTHLYLTYYPRFFAAETTQCNGIQFMTQCTYANVLPMSQDRRRKMNKLTDNLNQKIKEAVERASPPDGGAIDWVDTNPQFDGHRFCEEGVTEPSYRNDQIYFYPYEYTTGDTLAYISKFDNSTDCDAIIGDDGSGDWGDFYACEMAVGMSKDPNTFPKNYDGKDDDKQGDGDESATGSSGSGSLPAFLSRIFHPSKNGHMAYKDAILAKYGVEQDANTNSDDDVQCTGSDISSDGAKNIQKQWKDKGSDSTGDITITQVLGLDDDTQEQVSVGLVDGKTTGSSTYGDLADALQSIIDKPDCNKDGMVGGTAAVGDSGLQVQTVMGRGR